MRTRTLLVLAVVCGLAILVAGGIQLLRVSGDGADHRRSGDRRSCHAPATSSVHGAERPRARRVDARRGARWAASTTTPALTTSVWSCPARCWSHCRRRQAGAGACERVTVAEQTVLAGVRHRRGRRHGTCPAAAARRGPAPLDVGLTGPVACGNVRRMSSDDAGSPRGSARRPHDGGGDLYHDDLIGMLELVWGDGFLSPGGPDEVARVLDGHRSRRAGRCSTSVVASAVSTSRWSNGSARGG